MILGIDEVGRGAWAGPLVVGAVVLGGAEISGLTDSKQISKKQREEIAPQIIARATGVGIGWVHSDELDAVGLSQALRLATIRAVEQISASYHEIIIDGTVNFLRDTSKGQFVTTLKKADLLIPSVSAASIVAKVARDQYMEAQHVSWPGYSFDTNVGYGTAAHQRALRRLGTTPLHRMSFGPLSDMSTSNSQLIKGVGDNNSVSVGGCAEVATEKYLRGIGHEILGRNWKTARCEIDIISRHEGTLFFTEVKYRKSPRQGGGVAAITASKRRQMIFATRVYMASHPKMQHHDIILAVASVTSEDFLVDDWFVIT